MTQNKYLFITGGAEMLPRWREAFPDAGCQDADAVADAVSDGLAPALVWVRLDPALPVKEQVARAADHAPHQRVIVLSDQPDDAEAVAAFEAGAKGYCNTHAGAAFLRQVAAVIEQGGLWVGEGLMQRLLTLANRMPVVAVGQPAWAGMLSGRESEVAREVATGASNKEIARKLGITERTVKMHVSAIFIKLKVRDRLQLSLLLKS